MTSSVHAWANKTSADSNKDLDGTQTKERNSTVGETSLEKKSLKSAQRLLGRDIHCLFGNFTKHVIKLYLCLEISQAIQRKYRTRTNENILSISKTT